MRYFKPVVLILLGILSSGAALADTTEPANRPVILVLGDSLSAAYGMPLEASWARLLQKRLDDNGHQYRVINSSITGDTTLGGLTRLPGLLQRHQPRLVIIELGGNDGLRGVRVELSRKNLEQMIQKSQQAGAQVILAGIQIPPNYGETFTRLFREMYAELAQQYKVGLVPFFMQGVALNAALMQGDGIHPNAAAQPVLLDNVWPVLEQQLR